MFLKFDIVNENTLDEIESPEDGDETPIADTEGESHGDQSIGWREKVLKMATEVAGREGCEIYDFEFVGSGGSRALRVYIDKIGEGGVSIEDCSNVSRGLNLLLDVDDVIPGGAYNLEVSSPGLERSLRTAAHYRRAIGKRVQIKAFESFTELNPQLEEGLRAKLGKAKQLEGLVVGIENANGEEFISAGDEKSARIVFDAENGGHVIRVKVPLGKITKASTVFIFEKHEKKQGKSSEKGGKGHGKHK
ncbi:MAG: ribosome maturation factor RimP [Bdellovibrionales bacterium]|jgi:ribosome maturation factor RimP|nr:ribosome maturation factor RimP [Bdellovibrionales bacterium]